MSLPVGLLSGLIMMATDGTTLDSGNMILHCAGAGAGAPAGGGGNTGGSSYMNPHCAGADAPAGEGNTTGASANTTPTGVRSGDSTTKASSSNLLPEPENQKIVDTSVEQQRLLEKIHQETELWIETYKAGDLLGPDGDTTEEDAVYKRGLKKLSDLRNTCETAVHELKEIEETAKKIQEIVRAQAEEANKTNK